ncbi:MAG: alpha/beta fold hydrolase [Vicinamibacterales bacterium]
MPTLTPLRYLEARPPAGTRMLGTLVLLHAFPLNARMWEPQMTLASEGWRVIAPQMKGMDGASGETPDQTFDAAAGSLVDLLDALHIEQAVIGGLSMGGYLAFATFARAPRYFAGLVLADTRADADPPAALEGRQKMLALARTSGSVAVADEMIPKLLGETTRRTRPNVAEQVRALAGANPAEAVAAALTCIMTRQDSAPLLSRIDCPTLVLVGEEDAVTPPALSRDMHRAIAGSELVTVSAAGHLANLEQPDPFNAALSRFLSRAV